MQTLTFSTTASGLVKEDGSPATFNLTPGKRYVFQWKDTAGTLSAGVLTPVQSDGTVSQGFFTTPDSGASAITWDLSTYTPLGGGFEFVATEQTFSLGSSGFTDGDSISISLVEVAN